jgi:hypothetical protein
VVALRARRSSWASLSLAAARLTLQEDERVLQGRACPLTVLGERSITVRYASQGSTGSTGTWSSPRTVQGSAPESRIHTRLYAHAASRSLRDGRRKITASTTCPKAAPHLVLYVRTPPLARKIIIDFAFAVVLTARLERQEFRVPWECLECCNPIAVVQGSGGA